MLELLLFAESWGIMCIDFSVKKKSQNPELVHKILVFVKNKNEQLL